MERPERVLVTLVVTGLALASAAPTEALFTASSSSPANILTTAPTSLWFGVTGTGVTICTGQNVQLDCAYGARPAVGLYVATFTLQTKATALMYTVAVVDSTGPALISSIVTLRFASNGATAATIPAGGTDTVQVRLRIRGGTPTGTYAGWILVTEVATGTAVGIPLSVTR